MPLGYATFSTFYDTAIERIYAPYRERIAKAAARTDSDRILDLACGTGQGLPALSRAVPDGEVVGVDLSEPMLARARARVERDELGNVSLHAGDVQQLELGTFDAVTIALGMSVIGPWQDVFAATWQSVRPGGRYVIFDVYAQRWVPQKTWVQLLAGADLDRRVWEPLENTADTFHLEWLSGSVHVHGGKLLLAVGEKA